MFVQSFMLGAEYTMVDKTTVPIMNGEVYWSKISENETCKTHLFQI